MKKWPSNYYATSYECKQKHLRKANPRQAKKAGILGWRNFQTSKKTP
jgi:hypothetical protein